MSHCCATGQCKVHFKKRFKNSYRGGLSNVQRQAIPQFWCCPHKDLDSLSFWCVLGTLRGVGQPAWEPDKVCRDGEAQTATAGKHRTKISAQAASELKIKPGLYACVCVQGKISMTSSLCSHVSNVRV